MSMNIDTEKKYVNYMYNILKTAKDRTKKLDGLISTINNLDPNETFDQKSLNGLASRGALIDIEIDTPKNLIRLKSEEVKKGINQLDTLLKNCNKNWEKDNNNAKLWKSVGFICGLLLLIPTLSEFKFLENFEVVSGLLALFGAVYVLLEKSGATPLKSETHYKNKAEKFRTLKVKISEFKYKQLPSYGYKDGILALSNEFDKLQTLDSEA